MKYIHSAKLGAKAAGVMLSLMASLASAAGFTSGSTGADGAFAPTASATVPLPPNGIFNYTSVNIPVGVTITYAKNATNTPVIILASGNVTIAGAINVSGTASLSVAVGATGGTLPGQGGPGGYDGGRGGAPGENRRGGNGLGPGGGGGGDLVSANNSIQGGGGGGYGLAGSNNSFGTNVTNTGIGGVAYGSSAFLPLVGGSGGGGGAGATSLDGKYGTSGGGGGGAILIAASGTLTLTGSIVANGGNSGSINYITGNLFSATGGAGSGGVIRLIATNVIDNGIKTASGGLAGTNDSVGANGLTGGNGGRGRTSSEAIANYTLNLATVPTLAFVSVGGVAAPASPTGADDVALPASAPNPATVVFATTNIPLSSVINLTVTPQRGAAATVNAGALTGSLASATTSAAINIPQGVSALMASTSYSVTVAMGDALSRFANNERVEKITLSATLGGKSTATLVTVSGKEYDAPMEALRLAMMQ